MTAQNLSPDNLQTSWLAFSDAIVDLMKQLNLWQLELSCDHGAIRVNDPITAMELEKYFSKQGQILSRSLINGRPIVIIKLAQPLNLHGRSIPCIELPYPGGKTYPNPGWEHIELVFPSTATNCQALAQELVARVPSLEPVINNLTAIKTSMSTPTGENEHLANPSIKFKLNNLCIKIHPHSIEKVIANTP